MNEASCRQAFAESAARIDGLRLALVTEAMIHDLQDLAHTAGASGMILLITARNEAAGMHPRVGKASYAGADFPDTDFLAWEGPAGPAMTIGCHAPAAEIINLFFSLDVECLPFDEAVRVTSARRLAAAPPPKSGSRRKTARPR